MKKKEKSYLVNTIFHYLILWNALGFILFLLQRAHVTGEKRSQICVLLATQYKACRFEFIWNWRPYS